MVPELLWEKNKISSHLISSHLACWHPAASQIFFKEKKDPFQSLCNSGKLHQDSRLLLSPELSPANALYWGFKSLSFISQVLCFMIIGKHLTLNLYAVNLPVIWIWIWTLYLIKSFFFVCGKDKRPKKGRRRRDSIEPITTKCQQTKWILSLDMRDFWERFNTWQLGTMMYFD